MKRKLFEFDENETAALNAWLFEERMNEIRRQRKRKSFTILQTLNDEQNDIQFRPFSSSEEEDEDEILIQRPRFQPENLKPSKNGLNLTDFGVKRDIFTESDIRTYLKFLVCDRLISKFLKVDYCKKMADNFLLASVFVFFKRCQLKEYTRMKFFQLLYLAIEMEEDEEEVKYDILPWALGSNWRNTFQQFIAAKDEAWKTMNFSCMVSQDVIKFVMSVNPEHPIWQRRRPAHHSGAVRAYISTTCCELDDSSDSRLYLPHDPNKTPRLCKDCLKVCCPLKMFQLCCCVIVFLDRSLNFGPIVLVLLPSYMYFLAFCSLAILPNCLWKYQVVCFLFVPVSLLFYVHVNVN